MITVRAATLDDVPAIVAIHRSDLVTWKRWDAEDHITLANVADLTPYERWLNGGWWMDPDLYRPYLERLLRPDGAGLALVAEADGQVLAEAEAWLGDEPPPYGRNLNLSVIYTHRGHAGQGLGSALMRALEARAAAEQCDTMLVTMVEAPAFYTKFGFAPAETWRRARLPARAGNTQYTAEPHPLGSYDAVRGWAMPLGRYQSSRQQWERAQPGLEPAFDAWSDLRSGAWRLEVRREPALLLLEEVPRLHGIADVHLWTPRPVISRQLVQAIRDRGAQMGFRELHFLVTEAGLAQLGADWRDDGYKQPVWMKRLAAAD
ncbi:MAG: GNAT family N-acetyltransferase [Burkholderiaceae bacterium]